MPIDVTTAQAEASTELMADAQKEVVKKLKVIAKRTDALAAFTADFNKKVADFQAAVTAATTATAVHAALEAYKFPCDTILWSKSR